VESLGTTLVAFGFSVILSSVLLPYTENFLGYDLSPSLAEGSRITIALPLIALVIGILAGLYPALYLSSFHPAKVLKLRLLSAGHGHGFRKTLVVFQFVVSSGLLVGAFIVIRQLEFMKQKQLGFDKENILMLPNVRGGVGNAVGAEGMIEEMKAVPGVIRIARADGVLGYNNSTNGLGTKDNRTRIVLNFIRADYDFLPALQIKLKEGRNFSADYPSDTEAIILNETAAKELGLPQPAIGQQLVWDDADGKMHDVTVIGIVQDFHFSSFRDAIKPFGFILEVNNGSTFFVKMHARDTRNTLAQLETIWTKNYPERPFEYSFQDEQFANLYQSEARFRKLFSVFTVLAIFITCLGIFGLVTYLAESKTKEIGIRKVLGASVRSIVVLLSKDFATLVLIALVISAPVAYYVMQQWLNGFAYRIRIDWPIFAMAGVIAIALTLITVSFESVKAALANPVNSLRNE